MQIPHGRLLKDSDRPILAKERSEYGLIGDTVNIASRLESCAKERQESICRVLVGKETFVHWGPMTLKGKQQTIDVYRVVGWKSCQL